MQHGELSLAFLPPPTTDRRTSDKRQRMHGRCVAALESSGLPRADAARLFPVQSLPSKWEKLGDVALFAPRGMFEPGSGAAEALAALAPAARESLLAALAAEAGAARLGVQGRIGQVEEALHRKSGARLVWPPGAGGWVSFKENGVLYGRVAHSSASSSSLLRLPRPPPPSSSASSASSALLPLLRPPPPSSAGPESARLLGVQARRVSLDVQLRQRHREGARGQLPVRRRDGGASGAERDLLSPGAPSQPPSRQVVDLYAGIGYFTLPYLVHAGAAHVHACEWDEDALAALSRNVAANGVERRCTVHAGDNVQAAATLAGVAHRVNLGLIPSSEAGWPVAVAVLLPEGGTLHVHACVGAGANEEDAWGRALLARLEALAAGMGRRGWAARLLHLERVKSYAPRLNHVVADVRLAPVRVA